MTATRRPRLGKGLGALLSEYLPPDDLQADSPYRHVPVERIRVNPYQPRRDFPPEQLDELTDSIRENGLLQPLVVRRTGNVDGAVEWELVAGERRWRAVRRLGWSEVPALVRELDDRAMLLLAIVENVQRAELSPLEEAAGYRQLTEEFGFTQAEVAEHVGRQRSTVANALRLLQLPVSVQRLLEEGRLAAGHARALLGLADERKMAELARETAAAGLSVREVERRVRRSASEENRNAAARARGNARREPHLRHLERELQRAFGAEVRIRVGVGERGKVEVPYVNAEDFERILDLLLSGAARDV